MMTFLRLHVLDEVPRPHTRPLLGAEGLRRLAWSVWYLDATNDAGNYFNSNIADGAMTIQLPSDERPFLLHQHVVTEPLHPVAVGASPGLSIGAHSIRANRARQFVAGLHLHLRRGFGDPAGAPLAERRTIEMLDTLPESMRYSKAQYVAHKGQHTALVHLHVMRNTVIRHIAHLHLHIGYANEAAHASLVAGARELSGIFADALELGVVLDPQMAMHAYNGIEGGCSRG